MQKNFPGFGYESLQLTNFSQSKKNVITDSMQKEVQSNFLVFDWDKFMKPKNKKILKTEIKHGIANECNHRLAKLFNSL